MPPSRLLVALAALLAAGVFFVGLAQEDAFWLRLLSKPWPVLALILWVRAARRDQVDPHAGYARWIEIGLWLCLLGDVLLEERDRLFLAGVLAFLAGHVGYLVAYFKVERRVRPMVAVPFAAWGAGLFTHLLPGLGSMTVPLAVYAAALSSMMWRAAARLERGVGAGAWLAAGGALAFGLSDSLIALDRYGEPIEHVRYPIMALYWLGQAGIAASAVWVQPEPPSRAR